MDPVSTITPESFDLIHLFLRADVVARGVMVALAFASLFSWAVIIDKLFRLGNMNRAANAFEAKVDTGRGLEDIAADAGENPGQRPTARAQGRPLIDFYASRRLRPAEQVGDFRALPDRRPEAEPLVQALVRDIRARQGLVRTVLEEDEAPRLEFVGSGTRDACNDVGVRCIGPFEFFREQRFSTDWKNTL